MLMQLLTNVFAAAAGASLVLSYAPFGYWFVQFPALMILLMMIVQSRSAKQAAWIGWSWGFGLFVTGVFWLRISISQFGGMTESLAIGATLLFVAFIALYIALFAWLLRRFIHVTSPLSWMLLVPSLWFLLELARGWVLTGFPWLSLGYAHSDSPLSSLMPVMGVHGVSWVVMFLMACLFAAKRWYAWLSLIGMLVLISVIPKEWTQPTGVETSVAVVQGNVPQRLKWRANLFDQWLAHYESLSATAPEAQVVIWPETAISGFEQELSPELERLDALFKQKDQSFVTGIVAGDRQGAYYNAMITRGDEAEGEYYKHHLVPFGEFMPLKQLIGPVMSWLRIPVSDFSMGAAEQSLLELKAQRVGVNICYEDAFAREVLKALPDADWLLNASNDAWFGDSLAPHQHLQIARARAAEAGRYLIRATNTGISAVIDQRGKLVATIPQFEADVMQAKVPSYQGVTPYVVLRDWPLMLMSLLALGWVWLQLRWHSRDPLGTVRF